MTNTNKVENDSLTQLFNPIFEKVEQNHNSTVKHLNDFNLLVTEQLVNIMSFIDSKVKELNQITNKQKDEISELQDELKNKQFESNNFMNVSVIKNQDKQIQELKLKLSELESKNKYLSSLKEKKTNSRKTNSKDKSTNNVIKNNLKDTNIDNNVEINNIVNNSESKNNLEPNNSKTNEPVEVNNPVEKNVPVPNNVEIINDVKVKKVSKSSEAKEKKANKKESKSSKAKDKKAKKNETKSSETKDKKVKKKETKTSKSSNKKDTQPETNNTESNEQKIQKVEIDVNKPLPSVEDVDCIEHNEILYYLHNSKIYQIIEDTDEVGMYLGTYVNNEFNFI